MTTNAEGVDELVRALSTIADDQINAAKRLGFLRADDYATGGFFRAALIQAGLYAVAAYKKLNHDVA